MSDLLSFIISNTDKHEFSRIWICTSCYNDVMNQPDIYPQKMHSCLKNIRGISFFVIKISVVSQEKIYSKFAKDHFFLVKYFCILQEITQVFLCFLEL